MNNGFDEWGGYMAAKITKLEEQFSAASDPFRQSHLFQGISIYVNGLTNPSADELKRLMMVHGGTFHHYERSHTTYIIASNLPDVKVRNMNTSKIISPQWVVDCLREQRILDYTRYLLYTNEKTTQPRLAFKKAEKEEPKETTVASTGQRHEDDMKKNLAQLSEKDPQLETTVADTGQREEEDMKKNLAQLSSSIKMQDSLIVSTSSNQARTAVDPKFLSEFYNNSRLHHIATLGASFKQYISELREQHRQAGTGFPMREALKQKLAANPNAAEFKESRKSHVMHIDMDCFFVSVGLRKHPHLRGQPVAVTHSKGGSSAANVPVHPEANRGAEMELFAKRFEHHLHNNILSDKVRGGFDAKMSLSEIASCSYEARAKGLRNGMFVGHALKLCPELKTIPYDFEGYKEVAYKLYDIVAQYTLNIEAVSCDEMFVDLTDIIAELQVEPMEFVKAIREEVRQQTGCPCSAGVGANKLQARMATKQAKPDGQYYLSPTDVEAYMADIPIKELPGVGSSTAYALEEAKFSLCGDLQKASLSKVQMHVGKKLGETLHQFCRGVDNRALVYEQVRKSVSAEVNYGIRFTEYAELEAFLRQLCTEVHARLMEIKRKTKCITLKLMVRAKEAPVETSKFMGHGVCDNITKSVSLTDFTCDLEVITRNILTTIKALGLPPNELRGIGIQLSKLCDPNEGKEKRENAIKSMFSKVAQKHKVEQSMRPPKDDQSMVSVVDESKTLTSTKPNLKRTRGRPPGGTNSKGSKNQPGVMGLLQQAAAKKVAEPTDNTNASMAATAVPAHIDPAVFAELPVEIQQEILQERRNVDEQQSKRAAALELPSTSRVAQQKSNEPLQEPKQLRVASPPPPNLDENAHQNYKRKISAANIFVQKICTQLLLAWVKSAPSPEHYDIQLICEHAREIVRAKDIHVLYEALLYMCRLLNQQRHSLHCGWHRAYHSIVHAVQLEMRQIYDGRTLFVGCKLNCDKCSQ